MTTDPSPADDPGAPVDVARRNGHRPAHPARSPSAPTPAMAAGGGQRRVANRPDEPAPATPVDDGPAGDAADSEASEQTRKSVATVLVEIAHEHYHFALSDDGDTFAVPKHGPRVVSLLRGGKRSLRAQLAREYFTRTGRTAPQQALAEALLVIEGSAQNDDEQPLYLRVADHDSALWLDLGDHTGTAVKITAQGWTVETSAPVYFRRTALTAPLPTPVGGGQLDELWRWLNVEPDDQPLLAAWLITALRPDLPHPVLGLFGEQGTGKTSAMKLIVSAIDATPVPARKPPRDPDSWVTAAAGSWVVGLDNLSDIPPWLSDSICRAVTGDGDVRRRLYTDADLAVFSFRRCIAFNGIDLGGLRGDLADRLVPIQLRRITDTDRLDEEQLWPAWNAAHPRILGALLDLAVDVARALPTVSLDAKPRMADFARIVAAVDIVLGTTGYSHYLAKQGALATDSLTGDDFIAAVRHSLTGDTFAGTAAELLTLVTPDEPDWRPPKGWPTNARAVTTRLRRQAPVMRKAGWHIDDDTNRLGTTQWTVIPPDIGDDRISAPRDPRNPRHGADQDVHLRPRAGQSPASAGYAGHPSPGLSRDNPRLTRDPSRSESHEDPGQRPGAGNAGHAGNKSGPSHVADLTTTGPARPCTDCGAPARDISGLCPTCLTIRSTN